MLEPDDTVSTSVERNGARKWLSLRSKDHMKHNGKSCLCKNDIQSAYLLHILMTKPNVNENVGNAVVTSTGECVG